jgi:GNAT superfamily N-acetyltransferase
MPNTSSNVGCCGAKGVDAMIDAAVPHIRASNPADLDAVSALLAISYSTLCAGHYQSNTLSRVLPVIGVANPTLLASGTYYLAESETKKLVGCGGWTTTKPGSNEVFDGEAYVRHFATHPKWTRRGIGTALLNRCFVDARLIGIRKLHCFSSLNAEGFYQAVGFEAVGPIELLLGPNLKIAGVLMSRQLV